MKHTYTIGIDLGGTFVKIGLIGNGEIIDSTVFNSNMQKGLEANLPYLKTAICNILSNNKIEKKQVLGICLAFPGIVDTSHNKVLATNEKYDDADRLNLENWFNANFGVPFYMDNDARLAAIGEWQYGAAKGLNNVVMMTDTGYRNWNRSYSGRQSNVWGTFSGRVSGRTLCSRLQRAKMFLWKHRMCRSTCLLIFSTKNNKRK